MTTSELFENIIEYRWNINECLHENVEIKGSDFDYIAYSNTCENIFVENNPQFEKLLGNIYKNVNPIKLFSMQFSNILNIGNFGIKYYIGLEEAECTLPFREILAKSNIRNQAYKTVANFMLKNFPNQKIIISAYGQKDEALSYQEIRSLFISHGTIDVAYALHLNHRDPGIVYFNMIGKYLQAKTILDNGEKLPKNIKQFVHLKSTECVNVQITDPTICSLFIDESFRVCLYNSRYHNIKSSKIGIRGGLSEAGISNSKIDLSMLDNSLNENLLKANELIDDFENCYLRFETYFEVNSISALEDMEQKIKQKIKNLYFMEIERKSTKKYFENYIQLLNILLSNRVKNENSIFLFLYVYSDIIQTMKSDKMINMALINNPSSLNLDFTVIDFENLCLGDSFFKRYSVTEMRRVLYIVFSNLKKQKTVELYFLIKFYKLYLSKNSDKKAVESSKKCIRNRVKKFINKITKDLPKDNKVLKCLDVGDFFDKMRQGRKPLLKLKIIDMIQELIQSDPLFFLPILTDRILKNKYVYGNANLNNSFIQKIVNFVDQNNYSKLSEKYINEHQKNFLGTLEDYIQKYYLEFTRKYIITTADLKSSIDVELLKRFLFFETKLGGEIYRGPYLFLKVYKSLDLANKNYLIFMCLNLCFLLTKCQRSLLPAKFNKFRDEFFRKLGKSGTDGEKRSVNFLKGLYIYDIQGLKIKLSIIYRLV
jgi:hypothetical protein